MSLELQALILIWRTDPPPLEDNSVTDGPEALQTRAGEQGGPANGEHLDSVPLDEEDTGRSAHDLPTPTSPTDSVATPQPKTMSPKLRSARRKGNNGITFSDYASVDTLIKSPTIVKLKDGSYVELEVKAIQEGKKGVGFVRCEGSERVRPKKSYRDFVVREV